MKNIIVYVVLFIAFSACSKGRKISEMNGEYPVSVHFHRMPYRSNMADTILKDFDTIFQANVTISGYKDTITMEIENKGYGYPDSENLKYAGTKNDTVVYSQTYPGNSGLPTKQLYFFPSKRKIYYLEKWTSGHSGSYTIEMKQY